jgi:hypothetical protein
MVRVEVYLAIAAPILTSPLDGGEWSVTFIVWPFYPRERIVVLTE